MRDPEDERTTADRDADDHEAEEAPRKRGSRARLEALVPEIVRKVIAQGATALGDEKLRDTLVAEVVRKAVSMGSEVVDNTEDGVRRLLGELPLPREVADKLTGRLDEYKGELFRIVKQEVHEFLEHIDLGAELQKLLTSLSFEITTEIRFIPNEKAAAPGKLNVKPDVKAGVKLKKADERRGRRSRKDRDGAEEP